MWPTATLEAFRSQRTAPNGQVLVLFAVGVFVLLGAVGLGIDGSRTFEERRAAQTAVDHAATAAAFAACAGDPLSPEDAGLVGARRNGYDDAYAAVDLSANPDVTVSALDGAGNLLPADTFRATIRSTVRGTFSRVLGINDLTISVEATAGGIDCGAGGGRPGPIFAGGEICGDSSSLRNVEISGNDHTVTGLTHSNGSFYNGGSSSTFQYKVPPYDPTPPPNPPSVSYRENFTGGSNTYTGAAYDDPAAPRAWPTGFGPTDMDSLNWNAYRDTRVNADATTDKFLITTNGVYYTDRPGGVDVEDVSPGVTKFVVVNKSGPIKFGKDYGTGVSRRTFQPYNAPGLPLENVIAISGFIDIANCDKYAIEKSGAGGMFDKAIMWAPRAMVRWSGNEAWLNGSIISHAFQMNGNDHVLNGDPSLFQSDPSVHILK
jgi:hypothetical protein